jgi:hypothetical protein
MIEEHDKTGSFITCGTLLFALGLALGVLIGVICV